jgi:hypothetical protein
MPADEVFDRHVADVAQSRPTCKHLFEAGQNHDSQADRSCPVRDVPDERGVGLRNGDDNCRCTRFARNTGKILACAKNRYAIESEIALPRIVINEPYG